MNLYRINISSVGNGWSDNKSMDGEVVFFEGGATVKYALDGDECLLTANGGKVTQRRDGAQRIAIEFEEGKVTKCILGSGGLSGSYEIFTKKINFISGVGGLKLTLEYESGCDREKMQLTLTALLIKQTENKAKFRS